MDGLLVAFWVVMVVIATAIGSSKGRSGLGFFLGFFLGLLGIIIIACLGPAQAPTQAVVPPPGAYPYPNGLYPCPRCRAWLRVGEVLCPNCHQPSGSK